MTTLFAQSWSNHTYAPRTTSGFFKHEPYDFGERPVRIDGGPNGRVYRTPAGKIYPSVTNVLGVLGSKGLDDWRAAVGDEPADLAVERGVHRGSQVHRALELFIANETVPPFASPKVRDAFDSIAATVKEHLTVVHGQEVFLWSDELEVGGAFDLAGLWDNLPTIGDFKTSSDDKTPQSSPETFIKYSLQIYFYRVMLRERMNKDHKQLRIIMSVDHDASPARVFSPSLPEYVLADGIRRVRDKYREFNGI